MTRTRAGHLSTIAAAALVAGCATGPAPSAAPAPTYPATTAPTSSPTTAAPPSDHCPPGGVRITELGVSAAMGLRAMGIELVNCGSTPYRLKGWPVPRLRDADGDPIEVRIVQGAHEITAGFDAPPRQLVLRPGERAGAALIWRNLVDNPTVPVADGRLLEIAPAAGRPAVPVDLDGPIDLGNTNRLGVSAWKRKGEPSPSVPPTSAPTEATPSPDSRL
ncbi:DUF4232 domain-containing protein [Micromonospora halophytica]|uniref:DUF4232 domain-containing protein n=1 Tax=Micromonospora halophytica TaxID=47864 RepID=A0A1C5ITM9_9ACTN|nr:DUF4232 domain-containing protein [Micromonospora halophytica]SCG61694.1 Protein of unknown function [Micromonospora halophytica]